jgi:hypothetical protein
MLAFTLVFEARPIAIGSRLYLRWLMLAGMTRRPAAISSRTASAALLGEEGFEVGLALGDAAHLGGDDAEAGVFELGDGGRRPGGGVTRRVMPLASVKM